MNTASDVLGPGSQKPFITLSWAGRNESAHELAPRIAATTARVSAQYPVAPTRWFRPPTQLGEDSVELPEDLGALAEILNESFDRTLGDYSSRTSLSLFLQEGCWKEVRSEPWLSVAVGSGERNIITLRLTEDFPLGSPSKAARLLLDLIRVWRPDSAELMTISAVKASLGTTPYNHVGYMLWTSPKAYGPYLPVDGEIVMPHGECLLHVAKVWTDQAVVKLHEELGRLGTQRALIDRDLQDPPHIPEGYPPGLDELDGLVSWGREPIK